MSLQKALCLICTLPTADGAVHAVKVDKVRLQTWFLNVCGRELPHEIADEDKICYFCLWQAEFMRKHNDVMADDALVWWPENVDLDNAARELRKNFLKGNANQCWVQLENVKLPESEDEENATPNHQRECIYCGNRFDYPDKLSKHVKKTHKDEAIRCGNYQCVTYFHSLEEREEHDKNVHEQSKELDKFECTFCGKECEGLSALHVHVRRNHKEFSVKCTKMGCGSFFKTKVEMDTHFDSAHGIRLKCNDCDHKAPDKYQMELHFTRMHWPKCIKCPNCEMMFSTKLSLAAHIRDQHNFKVCKFCKLNVSVMTMRKRHLIMKTCVYCKIKFPCKSLYKSHSKACRENDFNTKMAEKHTSQSLESPHEKSQ